MADGARGKPSETADLLAYLLPIETRHDDRARAALVLVAEAIGDLRKTAQAVKAG